MNRKLWSSVTGSVLLIQVVLWGASSSGAMAAEAWAQTILHLAAKMEPPEKPVGILLCDELQEHLSTERFAEVGNAYVTYFGHDWNGDEVWMAFVFGR